MKKYNVWLPYKLFVVKTVEAESEKEAIDKVLDEASSSLGLCYQCMKDEDISDSPELIEDDVTAEIAD